MWLLQAIAEEHNSLQQGLKLQEAQARSRLQEEKSHNATLLDSREGASLHTEPSLSRDSQQLVDTLQQTEAEVKVRHFEWGSLGPDLNMKIRRGFISVLFPSQALHIQVAQLEEAQTKADSRLSNHKQAMQLLQTELQESRAQVDEKEKTVQILRNKLRESEVGFPLDQCPTHMHAVPDQGLNDVFHTPHRKMPHRVQWRWKSCGQASSKRRWSSIWKRRRTNRSKSCMDGRTSTD